jgi:aryl-alcohol dehydrogenase-like predicted oxidoreductase
MADPSSPIDTPNKEQDMEYRSLGRTGVKVSPLCLGTMNFGDPTPEDESIRIIHQAIEGGINFVDTANVYNSGESERIVGKALKQSNLRDEVILATKCFFPMGEGPNQRGASRYHIIKACEDSLRRLQTDHIDLYQIHRPDFDIPIDETLSALTDLVRQGKVRYIGCSTYPAWKVMEALMVSEQKGYARYVTEQPPYNLLDRRIENELVPLAMKYGMGILPWSPLAMGMLAGRYPSDGSFPVGSRAARWSGPFAERITRRGLEVGVRLVEMAAERNLTAAQLAILWVKDQPGITAPIIGPRTMNHLAQMLPLLEMNLADEDRPLFDELNPPGTAVSDFHNTSTWMKMKVLD